MSETKAAIGVTARSRLGDEIVSRINQLGTISETGAHLARIFLSPEHRTAADLLMS
jgi:allantoate deiminase